jgi:thiosulfate dehydrogenase (quinone) large subunit
MQNKEIAKVLHFTNQKKLKKCMFLSLVVLMRFLFGVGWLLAGVTKILGEGGSRGHSWFAQPGIFLNEYLLKTLDKPNVPDFYKFFIEEAAIKQVLVLNYAIPIIQVMIGLFLILGFLTLPSILTCLFLHINFLLSGNINLMSLTLYTSAFGLLLSGKKIYLLSLDQYFKLDIKFNSRSFTRNIFQETLTQNDLKILLDKGNNEISNSDKKAYVLQRIE